MVYVDRSRDSYCIICLFFFSSFFILSAYKVYNLANFILFRLRIFSRISTHSLFFCLSDILHIQVSKVSFSLFNIVLSLIRKKFALELTYKRNNRSNHRKSSSESSSLVSKFVLFGSSVNVEKISDANEVVSCLGGRATVVTGVYDDDVAFC